MTLAVNQQIESSIVQEMVRPTEDMPLTMEKAVSDVDGLIVQASQSLDKPNQGQIL